MKTLIPLALLALTAGCMADAPPADAGGDPQTRLAAALQGRVQAGPPVSCVSSRNLGGNESIGQEAILFRTQGRGLVYVNRPRAGCPEIGPGRALRVTTPSTQLCSGEIVTVFDPVSGIEYGGCGLGEFTPYRRQR